MRALRERRQADCHHPVRRNFNPRSPYGEGHPCGAKCNILGGFNPRSPYGERQAQRLRLDQYSDFNPRSEERRVGKECIPRLVGGGISIHAPRTGSDEGEAGGDHPPPISIHAPRTGSDFVSNALVTVSANFNPRSPYGERRASSEKNLHRR